MMKKAFRAWVLALLMTCVMCGISLADTSYTSGNYTYVINEDGVSCTITKYSAGASSVTVPASLGGYKVTAIGSDAFSAGGNYYYLTSVDLSKTSVASIGEDAFSGLSKLTSVKLPSTLKHIGDSAFSGCSKVTSLTLPAGLESIGSYAFSRWSGLTTLTLPTGLESVGSYAFSSSGLTSVTIPVLMTQIDTGVFYNCSKLASVSFPATLTSIGQSAFADCTSLTALVLPAELQTIEASAFSSCRGLTELTIPEGVTSIGTNAFKGCTALKKLTLSASLERFDATCISGCTALETLTIPEENEHLNVQDGVVFTRDGVLSYYPGDRIDTTYTVPEGTKGIAGGVFRDNSFLTSIVLPSTLETIGDEAFYNCSALMEIVIPDSVTHIGNDAFYLCRNLKAITLSQGLKTLGNRALGACSSLTEVKLPAGLTTLGSAFYNCSALTEIVIPDGVTELSGSTFYGCSKLTAVMLPANLTSIGSDAFYGCAALREVYIPDSVTTLGTGAFRGCTALASIHLPAGLTQIPDDLLKNCKALTELDIPDGVSSLGSSVYYPAFAGCTGVKTLHLPASLASFDASYLSSMPLSTLTLPAENTSFRVTDNILFSADGRTLIYYPSGLTATAYTVPEGTKVIGEAAFQGNQSLLKVTLPDGLTSIGSDAFAGCSALVKVVLPESATSIGRGAFSECARLELINLPAALKKIEKDTFYRCGSLASIDLPDGLTEIGSCAFYACTGLGEIDLPRSVTYVDYAAFQDCTGLVRANLPGVRSMSDSVFGGCTALESVAFPSGCTLGGATFYGCTSLKRIPALSSLKQSELMNCSSLSTVVLNSGVYSMADAFSGCIGLKDVYILNQSMSFSSSTSYFPLSVTIHGYAGSTAETYARNRGYAFQALDEFLILDGVLHAYNGSGGAITIPSSVKEIGRSAFEGNLKITSVTIPGTVKTVGSYAFYNCDNMTTLTLGNGVETLMDECFSSCNSLVDVTLPSSIRTMLDHVFYSAYSLRELVVPEGVTELPESFLAHAESLESITLPSTLRTIQPYAFNSCYALRTLTVPAGVEKLGDGAFVNCTALETLCLPDGIASIGRDAFAYVPDTLKIYCSAGSVTAEALGARGYCDPDYPGLCLVESADSITAAVLDDTQAGYILPQGVAVLGQGMFAGCENLNYVVLPASVSEIADGAFDVLPQAVYAPAGSFAAQWAAQKQLFTFDPAETPAVLALEEEILLGAGDTLDASLLFRAEAAYLLGECEMTYAAADAAVAAVEGSTITAVGTGDTTLTAALASDPSVSASIALHVREKIDSITLDEALCVAAGTRTVLSVQSWTPETAAGEFVWTIADPDAAVIDGNLLTVTAQTAVRTTLTASAWNGVQASMPLEIYLPDISAVEFSAETVTGMPGEEILLACTVTDQHQTWINQLVTFASSDDAIATVDESGRVTVLKNGMATITARAANGMTDSVTVDARISLQGAAVTVQVDEIVYNGKAQTPEVIVTLDGVMLTAGTDYTVSYASNINAGTAAVTVTGAGGYSGTAEGGFVIAPMDISGALVTLEQTVFDYTDGEILPEIASVKVNGMTLSRYHYDVSGENNVLPGTATLFVTGSGNYTGHAAVSFTIVSVRRAKLPDTGEMAEWAPYVSNYGIHEGENHLFLTKDLTAQALAAGVAVGDGETLYLDLNGHTINAARGISVSGGGRVILCDSAGGGTITYGGDGSACGILISENGRADMYSGTITGYTSTDSFGYRGGVCMEKNAEFNMYGGAIRNCTAKYLYGGGIYSNYGDVNIHGGTISGNAAYEGGGVYVYRGNLTITGGSICGNTAVRGGGVYFGKGYRNEQYTFVMSGGEVSGNSVSSGNGAGVYVYYSDMTLSGGRIVSNTVNYNNGIGGGLYGSNAGVILTGSPEISGNRLANGRADNLHITARITGSFTGKVGVSADVPGGGVSEAFAWRDEGALTQAELACFTPDNASQAIYLNDGGQAILGWKTYAVNLRNAAFSDGKTYASVAPGTQVTFSAVVPQGKIFRGWKHTSGEAIDSQETTLTLTMPMAALNISAVLVDEFEITDGMLTAYNGEDKAIVTLPAGVTAIAEVAFDGCTQLDMLLFDAQSAEGFAGALPEGVIGLFVREGVLCGCAGVRENLVLPEAITAIDGCAFPSGTLSVTGLCVTDAAFGPCDTLERISFPMMANVRENAFTGVAALAQADLPAAVQIGEGAFAGCAALEQFDLTGVEHIGDRAFAASGLTEVHVPDAVATIGEAAFDSSVTIVSSVSSPARAWAVNNGNPWVHSAHTETILEASEPTCTETGLTEGVWCPECGTILTAQEIIPAAGHDEIVDEAVGATCTEDGLTEGSHCAVCGEVLAAQEIIPAAGHDEIVDEAVGATCTEDGLTEGSHCAVCGEVLAAQEIIPAAGHTEAVIDGFAPTCTAPGLSAYIFCEVCLEELQAATEIPASGHAEFVRMEAAEPDCTQDGWTQEIACSVCGEVLTPSVPIPAAGHHEIIDEGVEATCTEDGLTEGKHCLICGEVLVAQEIVPASGHLPVTDEAVAPTDRESGLTEGSHCSVCGMVFVTQEVIPANFTFDGDMITAYHGASTDVVIPDGTTALGDTVFKNNTAITSVTVPDSVTAIGTETFYSCTALKDVWLPDHLTDIDARTFYKVTASIHVGAESATALALSYCSVPFTTEEGLVLRYLVTSSTGTPSAVWVVSHTGGQADVIIPGTLRGAAVTQILSGAFAGNTLLESVLIPSGVRTIAADAFSGCSKTLVIRSAADAYARAWAGSNGFAWVHDQHTQDILSGTEPGCTQTGLTEGVWCAGCGEVLVQQEIIPAQGHRIAVDERIYDAVIGHEVKIRAAVLCAHDADWTIGWTAQNADVAECIGHTQTEDGEIEVTFAATGVGATKISAALPAGSAMDDLVTIVVHSSTVMKLPASLADIEAGAFQGLQAAEYVLPAGVRTIGGRAFADNGNLALINLPGSIETIAPDAFAGCGNLTILCQENSLGHQFAQENRIPCIILPAD